MSDLTCPKCGDEQEDLDGFGFIACDKCGLCTHVSFSGPCGQELICDLCGKTQSQIDASEAVSTINCREGLE